MDAYVRKFKGKCSGLQYSMASHDARRVEDARKEVKKRNEEEADRVAARLGRHYSPTYGDMRPYHVHA